MNLASVRIGIAGAGGLGSNCAMLLVRSGIRSFTLADDGLVDASNLNRQFFFPEDVGVPKAEALSRNLKYLDPDLDLRLFHCRLDAENTFRIFSDCAIVVEALDRYDEKAMLCEILVGAGLFVVAASGIGGWNGPVMQKKRMGKNFVCVGDFTSEVDKNHPPFAPRVVQAAALQAEAVIEAIFCLTQTSRHRVCLANRSQK